MSVTLVAPWKPPVSNGRSSSTLSKEEIIAVIAGVGGFLLIVILVLFLCLIRRRQKPKRGEHFFTTNIMNLTVALINAYDFYRFCNMQRIEDVSLEIKPEVYYNEHNEYCMTVVVLVSPHAVLTSLKIVLKFYISVKLNKTSSREKEIII